jgi:Tol biopolymer transport system component
MSRQFTFSGRFHVSTLLGLLWASQLLALDLKPGGAGMIPTAAAYLGQKPPGEKPEPFASGFEKSGEPFFSPDGKRLHFTAQARSSSTGRDIWMVDRSGQGWGTPIRLPSAVNSDANEFGFSMVADGTMYFASNRSGAPQVYRAWQKADETFQVELIPAPILSVGTYEGDPCVAPDGRFLVFYSGRAGGFGGVDLQLSIPDGKGEWSRPVNLGADFNTAADEYGGSLSPDGKYLFFTRHGSKGNTIFWVETSAIDRLKPPAA